MSDTSGALAADREFFKALTDGNRDGLNRLLADDFILIDVMRGQEGTENGDCGAGWIGPAQVRVNYPC